MFRIELIGISGESLSREQLALVRNCCAIVASPRHRPMLAGSTCPLLAMTPIDAMLTQIEQYLQKSPGQPVAVLASGDPLCFGIGRRLIEHFGAEHIRVHPALSSLQLACARFGLPWDDLPCLSLHGRAPWDIPGQILRHRRVLLFTDTHNSPNRIAALLMARLASCEDHKRLQGIRLRVAEHLGLHDERLVSGTLAEIAEQRFAALNLTLVEQAAEDEAHCFCFGLREEEIAHSRGLITKDEVRAASLHHLRLPDSGVLWDIGGGSGSVSLEAARLCPGLHICTVERKHEQLAHIRKNIRTFAAYGIQIIPGEAPEALLGLPDPDRIFIGGSGGRLGAIITAAAGRLKPGGRLLINTVLEKSEEEALHCLRGLGFSPYRSRLTISRYPCPDAEPYNLNPITLIIGEK